MKIEGICQGGAKVKISFFLCFQFNMVHDRVGYTLCVVLTQSCN